MAIVQDALKGSVILSPLCADSPKVLDEPGCSLQSFTTGCACGYLSDAMTLSSHAAHSYFIQKAESLGQSVSNTTLERGDIDIMRSYLLKQSLKGCTGFVQFNSHCSRVSNLVAIYNIVPLSITNSTGVEIPWLVEKRAFIFTTPKNYSVEFWYPNGTQSHVNTLVFYDGTQNIPSDRIPRSYYRGDQGQTACDKMCPLLLLLIVT